MKKILVLVLCIVTLAGLIAGCAGSNTKGEKKEREPFIIEREPEKPRGMRLATTDEYVRSIQLYGSILGTSAGFDAAGEIETQFPTLTMGSSEVLRLEFDLMVPSGRPLSAYFYHADIDWQRDLSPAEYLGSFQRDDIINYTPSRATDVRYTHYTYSFPNNSVSFLLSGNYILRITEQGQEDQVLFERPFYITEQRAPLQLGIENVLRGQGGFSSIQPVALFIPPPGLDGNVFDYKVCFVRNGRFEAPRCTEQPSLMQQPALRFYLEPSQAFEPVTADYFVDLSFMRVGNRIARIAFDEAPYYVTLEPDYARFPGDLLAPTLNGQTVISGAVTEVPNPDVAAQYVNVLFSYVTESGGQISRDIHITGSFNGWQQEPAQILEWNADENRYEIELLLKQGQYEYRYVVDQDGLPRGTVPRPENLYTAMVYYSDIRVNTDRLISMGGFIGQ